MDANELLFFLKGHFMMSNEPPDRDAWAYIKQAVMEARKVEDFVQSGRWTDRPFNPPKTTDCGCNK